MASMKPSSTKLVSMEAIAAALKATEAKKENLHKAFVNLQSQSSCLDSLNLQWKDMEEHFNSIQKSLEERFKELEAKEKHSVQNPVIKPCLKVIESEKKSNLSNSGSLLDLKIFCDKMDGNGLRNYIMDNRKGKPEIRDEVTDALKCAIDPAKLVLDAMQGFYPLNPNDIKPGELGATRRTCNLLLEALIVISPVINPSVKEEAKRLAFEWKKKVNTGGDTALETFAFLQILAAFGLTSEFNLDEVLELLVTVVRRKQAIDLFRVLGLTDKVPDFIKKLGSKKKQLEAFKFVQAFQLSDKFPPVPILKAHLKETKKAAEEVRKKGNNSLQSQNEAIVKELVAVKDIIKCIEEHRLQSEYPRESLDKRLEQLEKLKKGKRRSGDPSSQTVIQKQQQQSGNKRPRQDFLNTTTASTSAAPFSQKYTQHTGLLPDPVPPYLTSSARKGLLPDPVPPYLGSSAHYGSGDTSLGPQYMSSAGHYGSGGQYGSVPQYESSAARSPAYRGGNPPIIGGNPSPLSTSHLYSSASHMTSDPHLYASAPHMTSDPHLYSSSSHMTSDPYDRSSALLGVYGLPPSHHPSYYP